MAVVEPVGEPAAREPFDGMRALLLDSNPASSRITQALVESWGATVDAADNVGSAIALLERSMAVGYPYGLVIAAARLDDQTGFELADQARRDPAASSAVLMVLDSLHAGEDAERCRTEGLARILKPLLPDDLERAALVALGVEIAPVARTYASELNYRGLRILLAEDNPVNQKVASGMLARRGHVVEIANNGREALEALEHGDFDVILMDLQMPVMSGFEATAAIRAREAMWGRRLPIIALTAHAMKGDRERCLEAGMDDHISKPLNAPELEAALERAAGRSCTK